MTNGEVEKLLCISVGIAQPEKIKKWRHVTKQVVSRLLEVILEGIILELLLLRAFK